ncbi:HEAT repeat domain-containing protein [Pirellulimonas nuda]|nr:HEAT repeat domain-containing protein [Pirellulimonas nuda]
MLSSPCHAQTPAANANSPAVQAALDLPRTLPRHYIEAAGALVDLGRADLAGPILEELIALNLDDTAKAELVDHVGSAVLLRMSRSTALPATVAPFVQSCLDASMAVRSSPERLAELTKLLSDPARVGAALEEIGQTGEAGVAYFVAALATAQDDEQRNRIREALVRLAPESTPALYAALQSDNPAVRTQAAYALGQAGAPQAVALLVAPAVVAPYDSAEAKAARWSLQELTDTLPSTASADAVISKELKQIAAGVPVMRPNANGQVALWVWDQKGAQRVDVPLHDAGVVFSAWLARDRWRLAPQSEAKRIDAVVFDLERVALLKSHGVDAAPYKELEADKLPTYDLSQGLACALAGARHGAARRLCELLGERKDVAALHSGGGLPSALSRALSSPSRSVRFAALSAIMAINPQSPYAGSNRLIDAVIDFAAGGGTPSAVVAMPNQQRSSTLAGLLNGQQVDGMPTNRGDRAIDLAAGPNVEMAFVDLAILLPGVRETLFQIRRGPGGGELPIALLASEGRLDEAKKIASEHSRVVAFPRPQTPAAVEAIVARLRGFTPGMDDMQVRDDRAAKARDWLTGLITSGPQFYNLAGKALEVAALLASLPPSEAIKPLAVTGAPEAQRMLIDYVNAASLPIADRRAAAEALAENIAAHGILLDSNELLTQYDRYNASESADAETQQVLGRVLDALERRQPDSEKRPQVDAE